MKAYFALLILLTISLKTFAFVELEDRQILDVEGGKLSPFWAQEYMGADLVKTDLRKHPELNPVPFAIYDGGFEKEHINLLHDIPVDSEQDGRRRMRANHGTSVANVINGHGMMGVSELVDYVQLKRVNPGAFYIMAVAELKKLTVKPQVISNSMGWSGDMGDQVRDAESFGVIWVMAAGNG